jgi:hypothetical protein
MNTREIEQICESDPNISDLFLGVFPSDKLPDPQFPSCFIANIAPAASLGEHWVVVTFDYNAKCNYFCSFARYPNRSFINFLADYDWQRTTKQLQSDDSTYCGEYCVGFLHFYCRNVSMQQFLSLFTTNYFENDQKIVNFVHSFYNWKQ